MGTYSLCEITWAVPGALRVVLHGPDRNQANICLFLFPWDLPGRLPGLIALLHC